MTEGKSYQDISKEHDILGTQLSSWWESGLKFINLIKKSNQIYANKKSKDKFADFLQIGQRSFFEWYRTQPRICTYCEIEEYKLQELFDSANGTLSKKRGRGWTLELERKDTKSNRYLIGNSVFACYLLNNHKSDLISEKEHKEYFAPSIRKYLEDKYKELKTSDTR